MKSLAITILFASVLSCSKKTSDVSLSFKVKDNKNMIIPNAEVYINQQLIGKTNKSGEITFKLTNI